jgi:serine/threonine-protein kinase
VKAEGPLAPGRAAYFVLQASRSLDEAHANGIVHRDVKPANLFVTRAGGEPDFVKVLDFGIAKRNDADAEDVELTATGALAGTPKYMAPELVLGRAATPRSDVYGLGAVLYMLLAGRAPFEGDNATAIYLAHVHSELEPPSAVRGEPLPPALEAIVTRCLAKEPSDRFADAGEVADAIANLDLRWKPYRATSLPPAVRNGPQLGPDDPTMEAPLKGVLK